MSHQNHSEPENRLTLEEQQEFLKLLARLSPEQREALKEVLKSLPKNNPGQPPKAVPDYFLSESQIFYFTF